MSLRTKVLLPLALFSAAFLLYLYGYWMPRSLANIESGHRQSIERHLDSVVEGVIPLLLGHQLDAVYENMDSLMKKNRDWIELRLLDTSGRMLYPLSFSTTAKSVPTGKNVHVLDRQIVYLEKDLGRLVLKVDFAPRLSELRKRHWELMSVTLVCLLMFVVTIGFVLDRIVMRPVKLLSHATRRLAEDDFDVPLQKISRDEVGVLVEEFDGMRRAIREYRVHLQRASNSVRRELAERCLAEKDLAERTMLAELSADIGHALAKQGELRNILKACAEALVRRLDAAFARIWVLNTADDVLELQASAGMYTRIDGSHSRVPVGKFKIGLIAQERKPHITNAVIGDARVHDQEWAKREGMVSFAGHPLTIDDKLVGVMAMFSRNPLTDVTLKALAAVSNEIAVGIERKLAEEALRKSTEVIEKIFSMTTTCIAYMDCDFNFIRVNKEYAAADGKTPEEIVGKNHFDLYPNQENEAIFRKIVETGEQHIAKARPFEYMNHPERGVSHWDWSLTPVKDRNGVVEGLILSLVDVTERIKGQESISKLNVELEQRVKERTAELEQKNQALEKMNKLFVGRELRMKELKDKLAALEGTTKRENTQS